MIESTTFDTNILLSATLWDGSVSQQLLFELIRRHISIYSSLQILEEYQNVLKRDFAFEDEDLAEAMNKILTFASLVNPKFKLDIVEDVDDNKILECAKESNSTCVITYDKHLLCLKSYEGILIINPVVALGLLRSF